MMQSSAGTRLVIWVSLWIGFAAQAMAETPLPSRRPPNIVLIVADDLGWNAVGYHNREFLTPHLDQLVASGMELDQFYVAPMCSPTRAGLLTGRYPIRFGLARAVIPPYRDFGLPESETTLAQALGEAGYSARGIFGKWHLGHRRAKWHPLNRGFTLFRGHLNGAIDYFELTREGQRDWHANYQPSEASGYATDLIASDAAEFIRQHAGEESPYFCYVPFNAPHSPFQAPPEALQAVAGLPALPNQRPKQQRQRRTYAAMIQRMDRGIGEILEAIESSGDSHNTVVWFFSDNGGVPGIADNNQPLRGSKLTVYEGGLRVAACIRWPAKIAPGSRFEQRIGYIDVMPTLLHLAGAQPSAGKPIDGLNVWPAMQNDIPANETLARRPWYSYHGQGGPQQEHLAVHDGNWKLKVNGPQLAALEQLEDPAVTVELFDLKADPREQQDLASQQPQLVRQLAQKLVAYRALQPATSVPPYRRGQAGFVPPVKWQLDPQAPDRLVGEYQK